MPKRHEISENYKTMPVILVSVAEWEKAQEAIAQMSAEIVELNKRVEMAERVINQPGLSTVYFDKYN